MYRWGAMFLAVPSDTQSETLPQGAEGFSGRIKESVPEEFGLTRTGYAARARGERRGTVPARGRILFICGSVNQTTQLLQVARELPEYEHRFSPYYGPSYVSWLRELGLIEFSIGGKRLRERALHCMVAHAAPVDVDGRAGGYDLVVSCCDLVVPPNVRNAPMVLVQEGILDPPTKVLQLIQRFPQQVPRWLAGTAATGLSGAFDRFCVASRGYLEHFADLGVPRQRLALTGIPNFDDCESYARYAFPHRNYVLVCTSDGRETFKRDDRAALIRRALGIAGSRKLIFKLHPNEDAVRAQSEIHALAPRALVYRSGFAEGMVARADALVTEWSTLALVGVALGKPVYSNYSSEELRALCPLQNRCAAALIADQCREVLGELPLGLARKRYASLRTEHLTAAR
ncbi:MAG: hypothetical protein R3B07_05715 [Polyangiaceae bacterium]